jgi:hypothetical protein
VVADSGWVFLLGLETRTSTRLDAATGPNASRVLPNATAAGRFWATRTDKQSFRTDLFEMRLVPK